ncbi:MAG: T9SS type A sorting domain-containing protein [Muribaculaceae bacterium]
MKKLSLLYLAAAALLAAGTMSAKTIDEVRVYINPGHGSWGPNDRPMATIPYPALESGRPDTCGFYESNTNLWKALKLGNTIEKMGVKKENIMYSRVKNGPYPYVSGAEDAEIYNRNLTEICEEVDANNMDIFISIHSNAASEGTSTNYPLFLYRGTDGADGDLVDGSYDMALTMWPIFYTNAIDVTSYYSPTQANIRGDISFYGSSATRVGSNGVSYTGYLGVLKHGAQGFLSEGYFHTYQPARHRALNQDYCHQEGVRYARGLCQWLGGTPETTGYIMGTVKDLHEKFTGQTLFSFAANSIDQWKPINGAVVTLYKAGVEVASYTVDNNYNGVFVFEGLQPADDYTLDVTAEGYKPLFDEYKTPITVEANKTTYPLVYLEATDYEPPKFSYFNYPDEINNPAIGAEVAYNFKSIYTDSEIAELQDKTIRRAILRDNNLYVLTVDAENAPKLYIINAETHEIVKTLGTEGTEGTELALADIQLTADGVLVACSMELCHYDDSQVKDGETRGVVNFYKWENDEDGLPDGNPAVWFTSMASGNFYRAYTGNTFLYKGTLEEGTIVVSSRTASAIKIYNNIFSIADGQQVSYNFNNKIGNILNKDLFGTDYTYSLSPINEDNIIVTGSGNVAREFGISDASGAYTELASGLINTPQAKVSFFKYAGHSYMVTGDVVDEKPVIKLIDITNGLNKATLVKVTTDVEGTKALLAATGHTVVTTDDEGNTTSAAIELVSVNAEATATKLTTENAEQPTPRAELAYDLNMTQEADEYVLTFKATGDATAAEVILTKTDNPEVTVEIPVATAITKGENTVTINANDIEEGTYNWAVKLHSQPIGTSRLLFTENDLSDNTRGGVTVVKDPNSPAFGSIVYSKGRSKGVSIYNPIFEKTTADAFAGQLNTSNGSSPMRITESNGTIYMSDWSDGYSGIWMFNPANPTELTQFFEGTRTSTGAFTVDDNIIGGGGTCVAFAGEGENRVLYNFAEDYPTGNGGNIIVRYDIGTANTWGKAPDASFPTPSAKLANHNVEILALENGIFASQARSSGNNVAGCPGFIYMDLEGNILFNSGSDFTELNECGSGIALNQERNIFAVSEASKGIRICSIEFVENVPQISTLYTIPNSTASEHTQMNFDIAGNLYVFCRYAGLKVFSVANSDPTAISQANKNLTITGTFSSIDQVTADEQQQLSVYPNPAEDVVTIEAGEDITSVTVFNLTGQMMAVPVELQEGNHATINVSNLAAGSYIVKVNKQAAQLIKK